MKTKSTKRKMKNCDLCHRPNDTTTKLCESCGESITRLMTIKQYLDARASDKRANREQERLLKVFAARGAY